jgi:hypothetical protein
MREAVLGECRSAEIVFSDRGDSRPSVSGSARRGVRAALPVRSTRCSRTSAPRRVRRRRIGGCGRGGRSSNLVRRARRSCVRERRRCERAADENQKGIIRCRCQQRRVVGAEGGQNPRVGSSRGLDLLIGFFAGVGRRSRRLQRASQRRHVRRGLVGGQLLELRERGEFAQGGWPIPGSIERVKILFVLGDRVVINLSPLWPSRYRIPHARRLRADIPAHK